MENSAIILSKISKYLREKLKWSECAAFWASIVVGFLAHGFVFTNKLVNSDEARFLFEKGTSISSGRWSLPVLSLIFPDYSMPWIYGVITILLFAISACIIVKIFDIKNHIFQCLTGALVISFPSLTGTFGYMFTSTSYAVAFLLVILSFWLFKEKLSYKTIIGVVCLTFSLGIYQAYFTVAAGLAVIFLAYKIFDGKDKTRDIIIDGIRIFVLFLVSSGLYFLITKLLFKITHTEMNAYAAGSINATENTIIVRFASLFWHFVNVFFKGSEGIVPTVFSRVLHIICFLVIAFFVIKWLLKKGSLVNKLIMIGLIILYPIGINCLILVSRADRLHTLTDYSYVTLYFLVIVILEKLFSEDKSKFNVVCKEAGSIALVCIVAVNIYVANEAYLDYNLRYENAYSFYIQIATQIKMQPEYNKTLKVAIIGEDAECPEYYSKFNNINNIEGIKGFSDDMYWKNKFVKYYVGLDSDFASETEMKEISETSEYKEMPLYPDYGSIKRIGDYMVVKLGETQSITGKDNYED